MAAQESFELTSYSLTTPALQEILVSALLLENRRVSLYISPLTVRFAVLKVNYYSLVLVTSPLHYVAHWLLSHII